MWCKSCEGKVERDQVPKFANGFHLCRRCEAVFELANRLGNVMGYATLLQITDVAVKRAETLYGEDGMDEPEYTTIVSLLQMFRRNVLECQE